MKVEGFGGRGEEGLLVFSLSEQIPLKTLAWGRMCVSLGVFPSNVGIKEQGKNVDYLQT